MANEVLKGIAIGTMIVGVVFGVAFVQVKIDEVKYNHTSARQAPAVQWCRDQGYPLNWRINNAIICIDKDGHLIYAKGQ